ncbi:pyruvate formate-lyase-activating protein [Clostridiaceae bacterium 35-E11]
MKGRIHSIETMGLMDGPGIRLVIFFQGCQLRCAYCHNPDTWALDEGKEMTSEELLQKALRFKSYFQKSGGGITCSGGEPLLQPAFLIAFLKMCKAHGLHTAIDTSGFGKGKYEEILKYTDLVILDIKHVNKRGYKELTGGNIEVFQAFTQALAKANTKLWIRHVVVPGMTDSEIHIHQFKKMMDPFPKIQKVELLPYHTLGVNKYEGLNIPYKLKDTKPMCKEELKKLETILQIAN